MISDNPPRFTIHHLGDVNGGENCPLESSDNPTIRKPIFPAIDIPCRMRFFNTAGPVNCEDHYCLPPLSRFNLSEIVELIGQKKYFVLHAPRQSGKTSCLMALRDYINHEEQYYAVYVNVEVGQTARGDVKRGIKAIITQLAYEAEATLNDRSLIEQKNFVIEDSGEDAALAVILALWCKQMDRPLVLLIDEIDALVGDTLISVLRQLRSGYPHRPASFPLTVILCGVRDVRDYRIHSDKDQMIITGGSAFNIKAKSLRLGNFSADDIRTLCLQHTEETGQVFESAALDAVWDLTSGQPWLVNALAYETCFELEEGKDRKNPITTQMVEEAKERLILRRETHLDQLADKLKEERVRRVIEPILMGDVYEGMLRAEDIEYVQDLGLITQTMDGEISISNRIYQEIIPRQLAWESQSGMAIQQSWFIDEDGRLKISTLIESFRQFFRENSESWIERFHYKEAGPQILLQAFLQRIINGGGRIDREYGLGRTRTDLFILWRRKDGSFQRVIIELKVLYKSREQTIIDGMARAWKYADRCGADEVHLIIFDRTVEKPWDEKIFLENRVYDGTADNPRRFPITIWGM